ncbi:MAG: hypothetical protein J5712_05995 [Lachnospiraceae bacterium]|nr:hypothetical protein [Lachnospiraceae bacterium]
MRKSKRNRLFKAVGEALAAVTVIAAGFWFGHSKIEGLRTRIGELTAAAEEQKSRMTRVICTGRDIGPGEKLVPEDIYIAEVPSDAVPADCVSSAAEIDGSILRIPVMRGAYITSGMLVGEAPGDDERELRYGCVRYDSLVGMGDCIDVRVRYPDGTDYVVLSKKPVYGLDEQGLLLRVREEEILLMDSAVVDASLFEGTYLYAANYVEDLIQEAAIVNYTPAPAVIELIGRDPNIVRAATEYLSMGLRNDIEGRMMQNESD